MNRLVLTARRVRDRPLAEHERHSAMVTTVVLLAVTAVLFVLNRPAPPAAHATPPANRAVVETGNVRGGLTHEAVWTARRFLAGYLAYTHGHRTASQINNATPTLIRSLHAHLLPVPAVERARHSRIVSLRATVTTAGRIVVVAVINDGGLVDYTLPLVLERDSGRLLVSGLDGAP